MPVVAVVSVYNAFGGANRAMLPRKRISRGLTQYGAGHAREYGSRDMQRVLARSAVLVWRARTQRWWLRHCAKTGGADAFCRLFFMVYRGAYLRVASYLCRRYLMYRARA